MKTSVAARAGLRSRADNIGRSTSARARRALPKKLKGAKNATGGGHITRAPHQGLGRVAVAGRAKSTNASSDGLGLRANNIGLATAAVTGRADIVAGIKTWHRERMFAMNQRKRIDLALGAYLRTKLGWHKDLPKPQRDKIAKKAAAIVKSGDDWSVPAAVASRAPWEKREAEALKHLQTLAVQLPVWSTFGEPIRGFGPASLATIIAESGDLANYSSHSKLWKRLGLAVIDGQRQGNPLRKTAEEWIEHGYSPKRRSLIWNVGDPLIKWNGNGRYRTAYDTRKTYEIARDPEIKPIIAHRRAQRYMEKKLLRDLWKAWRLA